MTNGKPDEVDLKILRVLQQNAAIEVKQLASMVHRSPSAVHERLKKLRESGLIKGSVLILDREQIGLPVLVVVMVKLDSQTMTFAARYGNFFKSLPEVRSCLHLAGNWDFVLEVVAATPQAYHDFLMAHICDQPGVNQVQSNFVLTECKSYGELPLLALPIHQAN